MKLLLTLLAMLAALPLSAAVLPIDLPKPDPADKGVKNKSVKPLTFHQHRRSQSAATNGSFTIVA